MGQRQAMEGDVDGDAQGLPPDRGGLETERRNPRTMDLDALSPLECARSVNAEDHRAPAAVEEALPAIAAFVEDAVARLRAGGRLVYLGAGTSGRLGVLDAAECPPTFQTPPGMVVGIIAGGDQALRTSSEGLEDDWNGAHEQLAELGLCSADAALGIAAGGTTPYVLGGLEEAKRRGALTGLLVCAGIEQPAFVDHCIVLRTGPEALTGSTRMKAGAATKMALHTISTTCMAQLGKIYQNLMVDLRASNSKLRDRAARIVAELTGLARSDAFALLDEAGGAVKVAVVMYRRGVDRAQAERLLAAAQGSLRRALEEEPPSLGEGRERPL